MKKNKILEEFKQCLPLSLQNIELKENLSAVTGKVYPVEKYNTKVYPFLQFYKHITRII